MSKNICVFFKSFGGISVSSGALPAINLPILLIKVSFSVVEKEHDRFKKSHAWLI